MLKNILKFCLLSALTSCTKSNNFSHQEQSMLFGVESITQTRVDYTDHDNGGVAAQFEEGDQIGLYGFYNNFYYYYSEYLNFAESVIFANQGLIVNSQGSAAYSPIRSWTFSTIYGTAPHTLDCIAYYPFREGHNPTYVNLTHDENGAATLEYHYVDGSDINSNIDFMTAHTRYDRHETPEDFRKEMLALKSIPLTFTRRTASLNFKVTKPKGYAREIVVTGVTLHFDSYSKFHQKVDGGSAIWWSGMTNGYSRLTSTNCEKSLKETTWDGIPEAGAQHKVENLLSSDQRFFLPPDSTIGKIVFSITDNGEPKTFTWHPHVATIEANATYTLNLELDPNRVS